MFCLTQQLVCQRAWNAVSKPRRDLPRVGGAVLQLLTLLLILAQALPAQTTAGSISGRVTDPQDAAVPQAPVVALNQDQNTTVRTTADTAGQFVFSNLLPGRYTITVEVQGFKTLKNVDVVLNANATVALGALQTRGRNPGSDGGGGCPGAAGADRERPARRHPDRYPD